MQQIADISHNQGSFDAVAYAKRHSRIRLKATQGDWTDPAYAERVGAAHTAGLAVDHYSYLTDADGSGQADYFLLVIAPHLKVGDRFMADCEAPGVGAAVTSGFVGRCAASQPTIAGLIYGSPYFLRSAGITAFHGWGLVLADYTTDKNPVFWPPGFDGVPLEWQFTMTAHTAGIPGESDLSRVVRAAKEPLDLNRRQHRTVRNATVVLNHRQHPPTPNAVRTIDDLIAAGNHAKGIQ